MNSTDNSEPLQGQFDPRNTSSTGLALYHLDHVLTRIASALERIADDREDRQDLERQVRELQGAARGASPAPVPTLTPEQFKAWCQNAQPDPGPGNHPMPLVTPASAPIAAPGDPACVTGAIPRYTYAGWVFDSERYDGPDTALRQIDSPNDDGDYLCKWRDVRALKRQLAEKTAEVDALRGEIEIFAAHRSKDLLDQKDRQLASREALLRDAQAYLAVLELRGGGNDDLLRRIRSALEGDAP